MTSRRANDKANTVSLFPFLAVLLCTMGSLLVLLVVLAERASEQARQARQQAEAAESDAAELQAPAAALPDLEEVRLRRDQFEKQLAELQTRIDEEKLRLGHLEDHNRRVEHDLAKLYVANEQLKAVEEDQLVDQVQAEQELVRLRELVASAEEDLEEAREEHVERPAKTLFVYRGPNGTMRPPVYIECNSTGVTLQPEGVKLAADDFQGPLRSGNALALAVRATQDYIDRQQRDAGQLAATPYPLVIVRPGGRKQFNRVIRALTAADLQYGYEFLGADAVLEYAAADPGLAEVQQHAVFQARSRQELLAMAAPSRFGGSRRYQGAGGGGLGPGGALGGTGEGQASGSRADGDPATPAAGSGPGGGDAYQNSSGGAGSPADAPGGSHAEGGNGQLAVAGSERQSYDNATVGAGPDHNTGSDSTDAAGVGSGADDAGRYGEPTAGGAAAGGGEGGGADVGGAGDQATTSGSTAGGSASGGASGGQGQPGGAAGSSTQAGVPGLETEAAKRGANWAVAKPRSGAVAMRRPIRVVVAPDRLAVQPSRHRIDGTGQAKIISLDEHPRRVLDQFSQAIREHMADWGLAGRGMHWRPVLVLEVQGNAEEQARQLARALERGGVDVRLPATADARTGGARSATR